ncbi:MAG TPA: hypothetical protein VEF71_21915 [Streptosporangiaceae bacterium]|nr:hypothetical protein [Streptosporangiaceae bacterium]
MSAPVWSAAANSAGIRVIGFRLEGGTGAGLHRGAVLLARLI